MRFHSNIFIIVLLAVFFTGYKTSYAAATGSYPILVLANNSNFGVYTGEILKTEGFNEFQIHSIDDKRVSVSYLKKFNIVILAETVLSPLQVTLLEEFVRSGGNLIAFRPDTRLSAIFGMEPVGDTVAGGYMRIDTGSRTGKGITPLALKLHGTVDKYVLKGGRKIAAVIAESTTAADFPAVVENDYGRGHAMAFLYNLPQGIVYTRQGNYRDAGLEKDSITGIRAMDLFTGGWVDTTQNRLNQADEQMRLLSHGIETMSSRGMPLPRFWYFPDSLKCLVTLNNDGEDSKEAEFQPQFEDVNRKKAGMTLYIKEVDFVSKEWVSNWRNRGFEISGHPDDTKQAVNPDWKTMDSVYTDLTRKLNQKYGITGMYSVVNHWFVWCGKNADGVPDFTAQAKIEAAHGVGLDANYAHYDNNSNQVHFLGSLGNSQGNYTGSGLTMKFSDAQGSILNIYQQLNNVYDQQYMENKAPGAFYECFKGLMDRSIDQEVYSIVGVKAHNNEYFFSKVPLMQMLDYAAVRKIPVWTEKKLLDFLSAKDQASFTGIGWANDQLSFSIKSSQLCAGDFSCMIPYLYDGKKIAQVTVNGVQQAFFVNRIKGFDYAIVLIKAGAGYRVKVGYR